MAFLTYFPLVFLSTLVFCSFLIYNMARRPKDLRHRLSTQRLTEWTAFSYEDILKITQKERSLGHLKPDESEKCTICLCEFEPEDDLQIVKLGKCSDHFYHAECIERCRGETNFVRCPICGIIYGIMIGDMPNGTIQANRYSSREIQLEGYQGVGAIEIVYNFPNGSRNGVSYRGTSRAAYLPDNEEGREVLELLLKAFERKLTFTVGRSVTTGRDNCVVWNGIHHKTSPTGGPTCFGYPDPGYFERVKQELAAKGIY